MKLKRNEKIDTLRGIAVIAVVFGHAIQRSMIISSKTEFCYQVMKIIYSFHMPLFVMISGYSLYEYTKKYDFEFLKKRFFRLIIPTIVWSYIVYFMREYNFVGIKDFVAFPDSIKEYTRLLLWHPDTLIWFLYTIFACNLIFFVQEKIGCNKNKCLSIITSITICVSLFFVPGDKFGIAKIQTYFPIFILGYYIAVYQEKIKPYSRYLLLPSIITYLCTYSKYDMYVDNKVIYYLISTSACIILYNIVDFLHTKHIHRVLSFFSKNSLEIYLCQCICLNIGIGTGWIRVATIFCSAITISSILAVITNKSDILRFILYGTMRRTEMNSFYTEEELKKIGFKKYGNNVLISKKASIYQPELIEIGNNVRIDDFCILSGNIKIGNYVHIAAYVALYGKFGIEINDFCGCSARCTIYSATDDFSGNYMISPMVPDELTNVTGGKVVLAQYVQIGASTVVMPNIVLQEGACVGAMSFVNKNLEKWKIYAGIPCKIIKERSRKIEELRNKII